MKVLNSLSRWLGYLSATFIILLMLLVTSDVCGRYFFNSPIIGASELARHLMIIIVFPALAWTALDGKHVKVDFIMDRLTLRAQAIANAIMLFLALVAYFVITWKSLFYSIDVKSVVSALDVPQSPFYWVMTAGWAVFCISIIALIIRNISKAVKK